MRKMKKFVAGFLVMCLFIATFAQNAFANEGSKSIVGENGIFQNIMAFYGIKF